MAVDVEHAPTSIGMAPSLRALASPARPGTVWIDPEYQAVLEDAGIAAFDAMISTTDGRRLRALPDRENWRLDLPHPGTGHRGAFLKKHHVRPAFSRLRRRLGTVAWKSAGVVEAENIANLAGVGVPTMRLIAFGERLRRDGLLESFVLTEELVGFTQLDDFLRRRFPPRDANTDPRRDGELRSLWTEVADVTVRLHRGGFNHRDLYCCHFFIKEPTPGRFLVHLIDLQRVQRRRQFRRRWLVKDLAQLAYSAPREQLREADKVAFFKRYLGVGSDVGRLEPHHKRFLKDVLAKERQMRHRLGPHP